MARLIAGELKKSNTGSLAEFKSVCSRRGVFQRGLTGETQVL